MSEQRHKWDICARCGGRRQLDYDSDTLEGRVQLPSDCPQKQSCARAIAEGFDFTPRARLAADFEEDWRPDRRETPTETIEVELAFPIGLVRHQ